MRTGGSLFAPPTSLNDFVGQTRIRLFLDHILQIAKQTDIRIPPIILSGPTHSGKRTLASLFAAALDSQFYTYDAREISTAADVAGLLTSFSENGVGYISHTSSHRPPLQTCFALATAFGGFDITIDEGENARDVSPTVPRFFLFYGTEQPIDLSFSRQHSGIYLALEPYTASEIGEMLSGFCMRSGLQLGGAAADLIVEKAGGEPQQARELLRWVTSFAQGANQNHIDINLAARALQQY